MTIPQPDIAYLADRSIPHQVVDEAGMTCIVLAGWKLPAGYNEVSADLLIRLQAGYPDVPPDMWWFDPRVSLTDGRVIPATDVIEHHLGRQWQRWSRHFEAGQWQSGVDGLESFLALVRRELERYPLASAA